ncbi:Abi family protein [Paenibacillus sp. PsM32]|uniref:Abi family protein n=1 Tax=Paenibacillus sp. PsM32 TaxID=3030536 RepID=UPI00263A429C|nr:Abi family protein [Paenibacillus sp. PsM32]MDN4619064.1 Abi family protein [Paenibacillus sp. PsM32]
MNSNVPPLKPAISIDKQIQLLESRDLIVDDRMYAKEVLKRISYYRFTGYLLPFRTRQSTYHIGTRFETIVNLYTFDSELRVHLLKLCEYIEIQMRASLSYFLAMKYPTDSLCYRNESNFKFKSADKFKSFINKWDENLNRSNEIFIQHHRENYNSQFPIWVAVEVLIFSSISILYSNLSHSDKRIIAREFELKTSDLLKNWLHVLSVLRNKCAHFSRLYYTLLDKDVALSINAKQLSIDPKKLFAIVFSSKYLVKDQPFWNEWVTDLEILINKYAQDVNLKIIGFPLNWKQHLLSTPTDII